jgi:hypothetical protein
MSKRFLVSRLTKQIKGDNLTMCKTKQINKYIKKHGVILAFGFVAPI